MVKDRKFTLVKGAFINDCISIIIFTITAKVLINIRVYIIRMGFKTLSKLEGMNLCSDKKLDKSDIVVLKG